MSGYWYLNIKECFVAVQEFWGGLPSSRGNGANGTSTSGRGGGEHIEPRSPLQAPPHDLTFNSVEGDFQAGTLGMPLWNG